MDFKIVERDDSGDVLSTYLHTNQTHGVKRDAKVDNLDRIDIVVRTQSQSIIVQGSCRSPREIGLHRVVKLLPS